MLIDIGTYENGRRTDADADAFFAEGADNKDRFLWAAFAADEAAEPDDAVELCRRLGVHPLALEDLAHGDQRPKIDEYDRHMLVCLRQPGDGRDHGEVAILAGPRFLVSLRRGTAPGFSAVRKRAEREPKLLRKGSGAALHALLDACADRWFPVSERFDRRAGELEAGMLSADADKAGVIRGLHELREDCRAAQSVLAPMIEVAGKLFGGRVPKIAEGLGEYFRDSHDHLLRINAALESIAARATSGIQTVAALAALEESSTTKTLAAYAAIFAASTLMAGIWGMNFKNMPELEWTFGYPAAIGAILSVAAILRWHFKRKGWIASGQRTRPPSLP